MTARWLLRVFALATILVACSASAVRRQAIASNALVVISDTALTAVGQLYEDQQKTALEAACGHTTPCADPPAAREAGAVVRRQWDPVWASSHLLEVAHASWVVQLERCQGLADAGDCGPQLSEQLVAVTQHLTELRCGLRGLHVPDPFSGPVECGGASGKDAGE